jgi:hypothetical protein
MEVLNMENQIGKIVILRDFFWHYREGWVQDDFIEWTYRLMEQSGALSKDDEDDTIELINLDIYDEFILGYLDKLESEVKKEDPEEGIRLYQRDIEALLWERLEFLNSLAVQAFGAIRNQEDMVADGCDDLVETTEYQLELMEECRGHLAESKIICMKLFEHYVMAQELGLDFGTDYLKSVLQKGTSAMTPGSTKKSACPQLDNQSDEIENSGL